jgi:elongation factor Ts
VPEEVAASERAAYRAAAQAEGRDGAALDEAVEAQMRRFYERVCLLDQPFIRDERRSVGELVKDVIARTGENIQVRRFARFRLGEG